MSMAASKTHRSKATNSQPAATNLNRRQQHAINRNSPGGPARFKAATAPPAEEACCTSLMHYPTYCREKVPEQLLRHLQHAARDVLPDKNRGFFPP